MRGGGRFCGRFAQPRGTWARQCNFQASSSRFFTHNIRTMCSVRSFGELPLGGFAEQYSSIMQSFNSVGQAAAVASSDTIDTEDLLATCEELMEFVQIAEVPTLFTYVWQPEQV